MSDELSKNPQAIISSMAAAKWLQDGTEPRTTILSCTDIRRFITVRTVAGGGMWRGRYLGKVVRWVWSLDGEPITYKKNGNKVAMSDGAFPLMDLEDDKGWGFLDYGRYEKAAWDIIESIIPNM